MRSRSLAVPLLAALLAGCGTTTTNAYVAAGATPLCASSGAALGVVAVLPETAWRADQKEPELRVAMAERAIAHAFEKLSCGSLAAPGGVHAFATWSNAPEEATLRALADAGVETAVLLRIEELTPRIGITFSLPLLWTGASAADFRIRVVHLPSRTVRLDARIQRATGGPFQLRPPEWAEEELESALEQVLGS